MEHDWNIERAMQIQGELDLRLAVEGGDVVRLHRKDVKFLKKFLDDSVNAYCTGDHLDES